MIKKIITSILLLPIFFNLNAQTVEGESEAVKEIIMAENGITSIVFNYGSIGAPNRLGNIADFVYNGLGNMFEFGPLVAGEVVGESGDTLHIVSDGYRLSIQGDYSPDGTQKWGWLPRVGYANPNQDGIASSINPQTWPSEWTEWPGEFGSGVTVGLNEVYYVMDDFTNYEFPYYPFADSTKRGLGVSAEVRIYQFGSGMKDAMIIKYILTNESPKQLNKLYFGFHGDPHIGGPTDYNDDVTKIINGAGPAGFEGAAKTLYCYDEDMTGTGGKRTGYLGFNLLTTPNNAGLTSAHVEQYTNSFPNVPANDALMWEWLSGDIDSTSGLFNTAGDNIVNFGTGPFSLAPGEHTEIKLAIFMSDDFNDMIRDADYIYYHHNWAQIGNSVNKSGGNVDYKIEVNQPTGNSVNGTFEINWNYTGTNSNAVVAVEYSSNNGEVWAMLDKNLPANSSYQWNTENHKDGVNYLLRVVAYNPDNFEAYYYDISDERFKVDNPGVNAQPELDVDLSFTEQTVLRSPLKIEWTCEDADDDILNVTLEYFYNGEGPFGLIENAAYGNGSFTYHWNLADIPNANSYSIKLKVSDGNRDTVISSSNFEINVKQGVYPEPEINHLAGNGTPDIIIEVIDSTALTGNEYEITFDVIDQENTTFSVQNVATGVMQVENYPLVDDLSTPLFEGLKVKVFDKELNIDLEKSIFNRSDLNAVIDTIRPATIGQQQFYRGDWVIIFNDLDTASDGSYLHPGDTTISQHLTELVCPFYVKTLYDYLPASYIVLENLSSTNGMWDFDETIVLQPNGEDPGFITNYEIKLDFTSGVTPGMGDTLFIKTLKPVMNDDVFRFTSDDKFITSVKNQSPVKDYNLSQNYPNPFNPSTKINYQIPKEGTVSLVIYDVLGRKVQTLINEYQKTGQYTLEFDASHLASGMYIYSLQVNGFVMNRKMMLLK